MKLLNYTFAVTLLAAAPGILRAQSAPADTLALSLRECVEIALQDNPTIKVADLEVKRMDYSKKEVLANLYPSVDFSVAYQRSIELQTLNMSMGGQSTKIKMGSDNMWNMGFTAAMPIVNPTLWKSISMSKTQIESALESARASRLDMVNNVNKAYYALLLAQASRDVIKQNYDIAKLNADIYQKQFEQGTASEYDVLRSSVQVTNIEPELLQADIAIRQCELQLKVLMGMDAEVAIKPNISLDEMRSDMFGYTSSLSRSLADNTSLRSLDIQTKLSKQNETLKKFAWIPTIGISYNMNWNSLSNGNALKNQEFNPYSTVGVSLSVPIFSGGSKYYGLKQAQVQTKELALQRENLVSALNMQVDLAIDNINKQVRQIEASEQGMNQAAKAYQIMQKSFEIGATSYLNLRDSELANTSAKLAYLQSIYNYLVSSSELDLLLGKETGFSTQTTR